MSLNNKIKLWCFFLMFPFLTNALYSQQYDQWVFGKDASVDITTNNQITPTASISSDGASASYCDANGDLWFYTDGTDIFNTASGIPTALNAVNSRPNNSGATQGVVIVPKVGSSNEFYFFYVSDPGLNNFGLSYCIYNANLGTVSATVSMGVSPGTYGSYCESRVVATPHANGTDYWVTVKPMIGVTTFNTPIPNPPATANNSSLYTYLVSVTGVSSTPIISDAGYPSNWTIAIYMRGQAKFSPDKQLFATTNAISYPVIDTNHTYLYRFNSSTGVHHLLNRLPFIQGYLLYGLSFSPDSKVLYVNGKSSPYNRRLMQYDLNDLYCSPYIPSLSCTSIITQQNAEIGSQMQLTNDGRIFIGRYGRTEINEVSTPNNVGCSNIGYLSYSIQVATYGSGYMKATFPNNIDGLVANPVESILYCEHPCEGVQFWYQGADPTLTWDFGDGTSVTGSADNSVTSSHTSGLLLMPVHIFPNAGGVFTVTLTTTNGTITQTVTVSPATELAFTTQNIPICEGDNNVATITLDPLLYSNYYWSDCSDPDNTYSFPWYSGSVYSFNTAGIPAGSYDLCVKAIGWDGCEVNDTFSFAVGGEWPKTSNFNSSWDGATGNVMDELNQIYLSGEFDDFTTFEGMILNGNPNALPNSYLIKYDDCHSLLWTALSESDQKVSRTSIAINKDRQTIYVTGRCEGNTRFYSATSPNGPILCFPTSIDIIGNGVYVASYNYQGCLLAVHLIPDDANFIHNSAHVTAYRENASQDRVYLGINETPLNNSNEHARLLGFVQDPVNNLNLQWAQPYISNVAIHINDIDNFENTICFTGDYMMNLWYFINGNWSPLGDNSSSIEKEAFVIGVVDNGASVTPIPEFTKTFDPLTIGTYSMGTGVNCLTPERIYLTGNYKTSTTRPFDINTQLNYNGYNGLTAAYAVNLNDNPSIGNPDWIHSFGGKSGVEGTDVFAVGPQVFFTGGWAGSSFNVDNTMVQSLDDEQHFYLYSMDLEGNFMNTSLAWNNHSNHLGNAADKWMHPTRISSNAQFIYISGMYQGSFEMINDVAFNSPLTSFNQNSNSFLWRFSIPDAGMSFKKEQNLNSTVEEKTNTPFKIYPNPVLNLLQIEVPAIPEEYSVTVFNSIGQLVFQKNNGLGNIEIPTSLWKSGLYMIYISHSNQIYSQKIIKE